MSARSPQPRVLACLVLLPALMIGCGGGDESDPQAEQTPTFEPGEPAQNTERPPDQGEGTADPNEANEQDSGGARAEAVAEARRRTRLYIEAIDERDGAAICRLLADGALDELKLPVRRGNCAASLDASIGFADDRGFPVYQGTRIAELGRVALAGEAVGSADARVTATLVTTFEDRDQPSVEDDFVYLVRNDSGKLVVAKASANLYRAVGRPDIPPSVISPP